MGIKYEVIANGGSYTNKEGVEQTVTEIVASELHPISKVDSKKPAADEEIPF